MGQEYLTSALLHENSDLKKKICNLEEENMQLAQILNETFYNTKSFPKLISFYLFGKIFSKVIFMMKM